MGRNYGNGGLVVGMDKLDAVSSKDQADFLEKMIDTLEQGGWTQGEHQDDQGMCIEGAAIKLMSDAGYGVIDLSTVDYIDGEPQPPQFCVVSLAAQRTLRNILGAELGIEKAPVTAAQTSGYSHTKNYIEIMGYSGTVGNNPIPIFNDADGQTKERVIAKLREAVEEIRAGAGVFDGDAPKEPTRTLSTVPTPV